MQIMKKMRDEAAKSPGQAAAAASGPAGHSASSPAVNAEMNNSAGKQNSSGKDESRASDAAAAAAQLDSVSERTSDPSVSEACVSHLLVLVLFFTRAVKRLIF